MASTAENLDLGYSNASFQGRYGFSIIYGPRVATGVGVAISDGRGKFYGIQKLNLAGQFIPFTFEGTYEVFADGTGTATVTLTAPDGTVRPGTFDYVVLQALDAGTVKLATELQGLDRTPQDGYYGVSWFKRLP
jgi:hypothetical protein